MIYKKVKNNLFKTSSKGNITILVLIVALAVIVGTTAMVGYLFRDIGFTELDEGKLRALNFAEAGISNMFLNIEKYNKEEIPSLPTSPYTEDVYTDGEIAGNYTVSHESYSTGGEFAIYGYSITSRGEDKNGAVREVRVNILVMNIYDFIFSENTLSSAQHIAGNTTIVGPFLVIGELDMVLGNAKFLEGPLLVKGDINIGGSSSIGEAGEGNSIILFMAGSMFYNGTKIDPLNPPGNAEVYVDTLYNSVFDISLPEIDDEYINSLVDSRADVIPGDLSIGDGVFKIDDVVVNPGNPEYPQYLSFVSGILQIDQNTVVYGDITINSNVQYNGKANLVSTGSIYINSRIIPIGLESLFPEDNLLGLVTQNDIFMDLNYNGSYNDPAVAVMVIANNSVELDNGVVLRGSSISDNLTMGENAKVYFEQEIGDYLPAGVPEFNNILFSLDWQEIIAD